MKSVYIVGGGNSLKDFDFKKLKDKDTIVINKSIFAVSDPTYFITCDYSFLIKIKAQSLFNKFQKMNTPKIFILQSYLPYLKEDKGRTIDIRYKNYIYDLKDFDIIIKSYKAEGVGLKWNDFRNGINSGICAIQYAILMGYTDIYLLGIDLKLCNKRSHFHNGYGEEKNVFAKKLDQYFSYYKIMFKEIIKNNPNINIYSSSKDSRLNCFIPYKEI